MKRNKTAISIFAVLIVVATGFFIANNFNAKNQKLTINGQEILDITLDEIEHHPNVRQNFEVERKRNE